MIEDVKPSTSANKNEPGGSLVKTQCDKSDNSKENVRNAQLEEARRKMEEMKQGWTLENSDSLTIGEMYLMFGADSKIQMEYNWDPPKIKEYKEVKEENNLSHSLQKLLSLAKIQCNNNKVENKSNEGKCTCGHVCGVKSNSHFKKPANKILKKNQSTNHDVIIIIYIFFFIFQSKFLEC